MFYLKCELPGGTYRPKGTTIKIGPYETFEDAAEDIHSPAIKRLPKGTMVSLTYYDE